MATKQRIVWGSTAEWSEDDTTYSSIAEVKALAVPTVEIEYLDATTLDSTGGYREYVAGLKDAGEITIPCGYTSGVYNSAIGYQNNGTLIYFRTTMPLETGQTTTGDVFQFTGYVRPVLQQNAIGELIGLDLVIRISGAPTFTEGS